MPDETHVGLLGGYQSPCEAQSAPHRLLSKIRQKATLRASLTLLQGEIDAALNALSKLEVNQLKDLIAADIGASDSDVAAFREQLDSEAALAETTRPTQVTISRQAVNTIATEIDRRVSRGIFVSKEGLVAEALAKAFSQP